MKIEGTDLDVTPIVQLPLPPPGSRIPTDRRKADALMIPYPYMGVVNPGIEAMVVRARFGQILDTPDGRLYVRAPVAGISFITGDPADTMYHARNHWRTPGQDRYEWMGSPDEPDVMYGFKRE